MSGHRRRSGHLTILRLVWRDSEGQRLERVVWESRAPRHRRRRDVSPQPVTKLCEAFKSDGARCERKRRSKAVVCPTAEAKMAAAFAQRVEAIGGGEATRITV